MSGLDRIAQRQRVLPAVAASLLVPGSDRHRLHPFRQGCTRYRGSGGARLPPGVVLGTGWALAARSVLEVTEAEPGFAYRVWRIDADGGSARPISPGPRDYWTSWSPDGTRLAYIVQEEDSVALVVSDTEGEGARTLLTRLRPEW